MTAIAHFHLQYMQLIVFLYNFMIRRKDVKMFKNMLDNIKQIEVTRVCVLYTLHVLMNSLREVIFFILHLSI